jgi:NADPH:quinone reductase-like Zn-dependent oxidoreductase
MHSIVFPKAGNSSICKIHETNLKTSLEKNQLRITVAYSGINFADIMARNGQYQDAPAFPCIVGYEVSGVVTEVGSPALNSWLKKEVMCMTHFGGYASEVICPDFAVYEKPPNFSMEEAAAFPVNYLTAYLLVVGMGGLKKEETILIHNAGGGVGIAALQLSKAIGARAIGTASSGKHARLIEHGLDFAINYRLPNWEEEVFKITENKGVELLIDPLGGNSWKTSYKLLRSSGRLGMFGISSASSQGYFNKLSMLRVLLQMPLFHPISLLNNNRGAFGVNMGHLWHENSKVKNWMAILLDLIEQNHLRPEVDKVFDYKEVSAAHDYMENRKNFGKVLLKM